MNFAFYKVPSALLFLLGIINMLVWVFAQQTMYSFNPNSIFIVFNTSLCLTILSAALLLPEIYKFKKAAYRICGLFVIFFSLIIFSQDVTGVSRGFDQLFVIVQASDLNPHPGRMAPQTVFCFVLCGLSLFLLPSLHKRWVNIFIQWATLFVLALAMIGLAGAWIRLEMLYSWYKYSRMAVPTAIGFVLQGMALWLAWYHYAQKGDYLSREEKRIDATGIALIIGVTFTAGMSAFGILANQTQLTLEQSLTESYKNQSLIVQNEINQGIENALPVTTRILLNQYLSQIDVNPKNDIARAVILQDTESFINQNFSALAIYSLIGKKIAEAGKFVENPEFIASLKNQPYPVELRWKENSPLLRIHLDIAPKGQKIGSAVAELRIPDMVRVLTRENMLGKSAETGICAPVNPTQMNCLPLLHRKIVVTNFPRTMNGKPFPMDYALNGEEGIYRTEDYRNHLVIAAAGPIGNLGLGMVVKIDAGEFYGPIRQKLQYALVLILILSALAIWIQRRQLIPLVARLVRLQREAQTAGQALEESNRLNNAIMLSAAHLIVATDTKGVVLLFNKEAERALGYKAEEIEGKHTPALWHDEREIIKRAQELSSEYGEKVEPGFEVFTKKILKEGSDKREWTFIRKDGSTFTGDLIASSLRDSNMQPVGFLGIIQDVTLFKQQQQALKASEETFRSAMEYASIGMALLAPGGEWLKVNKSLCTMIGYSEEELLSGNFHNITHPDDLEDNIIMAKRVIAREIPTYQLEKRYIHKNGHMLWVLVSASLVRDAEDNPKYFIAQIQDISERKEIERIKNEFISTVSHELRTPLTSIRGSLGLLIGGVAGKLEEKSKSLIDIAFKNCERLVLLINDILDIEKIESGQMQFDMKPHNLKDIIDQALILNQAYGDKYHVQFRISEPMQSGIVLVDANRLLQVLANLLSNAAKFSPPGNYVEITILKDNGRIRVCVSDHGPGVPAEFTPRIFQKFAQADASDSRQKGGTGLGLTISRSIIEHMRGTMGFSTTPEGATFYFDLPLQEHKEQAPAVTIAHKLLNRPRILICEDDEDIAALLSLTLDKAGFDADIAGNANRAMELISSNDPYDAMTLDILLPEKNGLTFLRELREQESTRTLPVIIISVAAEEVSGKLNGLAVGIIDCLRKPIDTERLIRAIRSVVSVTDKPHILHVEDDEDIVSVLALSVKDIAYVTRASRLHEAKSLMQEKQFDLIILDIGLPDGSGLEVLKILKQNGSSVPVIIFSADEMSEEINSRVAATLTKSKSSGDRIVTTITTLISKMKKPT